MVLRAQAFSMPRSAVSTMNRRVVRESFGREGIREPGHVSANTNGLPESLPLAENRCPSGGEVEQDRVLIVGGRAPRGGQPARSLTSAAKFVTPTKERREQDVRHSHHGDARGAPAAHRRRVAVRGVPPPLRGGGSGPRRPATRPVPGGRGVVGRGSRRGRAGLWFSSSGRWSRGRCPASRRVRLGLRRRREVRVRS